MLRARAVMRKEHLGLKWHPEKQSLTSVAKSEVNKVSPIFYTQLELGDKEREEKETGAFFNPQTSEKTALRFKGFRRRLRFLPVQRTTESGAEKFASSLSKGVKVKRVQDLFLKGINWTAVAWGWVVALMFTLVILGAGAFYVAFSPGSVYYLSTYLMLNKVVSPLLGGIVVGVKARQKSWQCGMWVGLGYGLAILIFRLYGALFSSFWLEVAAGLLVSLVAGIIGAFIGQSFRSGDKVKGFSSSSVAN